MLFCDDSAQQIVDMLVPECEKGVVMRLRTEVLNVAHICCCGLHAYRGRLPRVPTRAPSAFVRATVAINVEQSLGLERTLTALLQMFTRMLPGAASAHYLCLGLSVATVQRHGMETSETCLPFTSAAYKSAAGSGVVSKLLIYLNAFNANTRIKARKIPRCSCRRSCALAGVRHPMLRSSSLECFTGNAGGDADEIRRVLSQTAPVAAARRKWRWAAGYK